MNTALMDRIIHTALHILTDFPFQLIVATNLFAFSFPKRKSFWLRLVLSTLALVTIYDLGTRTYGYQILSNMILDKSLMMIPVACVCAQIMVCYRCSLAHAIFCCASAHPAQNLVYSLSLIILQKTQIREDTPLAFGIGLSVMLAGYAIVYLLFAVRMADIRGHDFLQGRLIVNSVIVMLFVVYLYTSVADYGTAMLVIFVIGDVLALVMQFGLFSESALEFRYQMVEELLRLERKRQRQTIENTEIINRKCHDLKHQLSAFTRMAEGPEKQRYLGELEEAILIYESTIATGSETLDLLLMEKLLYCKAHQITFSVMADGSLLSWMDTMDIYSLFGNAVDNAIESVLSESEEHRTISLHISGRPQLVCVHLENYLGHAVLLKDGLPVTSKADHQYHGFGMLSIQRITEKYEGTMSIHVEDQRFCLNLLFPRPDLQS